MTFAKPRAIFEPAPNRCWCGELPGTCPIHNPGVIERRVGLLLARVEAAQLGRPQCRRRDPIAYLPAFAGKPESGD